MQKLTLHRADRELQLAKKDNPSYAYEKQLDSYLENNKMYDAFSVLLQMHYEKVDPGTQFYSIFW